MPLSPDQARNRAKLAATARHHPESDLTELRAELRTATAAEYIRRLVDGAPPLSEHQRARLAALLRPVEAGAEAA